jgi:hypothetical protein
MSIANLHELLQQGQCDYRCYDLGRRVQPISASEFAAIAEQRAPYPYPHQNHAQYALVFWPQLSNRPEPFIWLLKLPIDERGLLDQQAQQHFISQVLALLGQQLTGALTEQQQQQLQQSPYLFNPSTVQQAALHAQLRELFGQPPSLHCAAVERFLRQPQQYQWQQLGIQGIHDVAVRLAHMSDLHDRLVTQLDSLPLPFLHALAQAMEHPQLPVGLVEPLLAALPRLATERQRVVWRMLSSRADHPALQQALQQSLTTAADSDMLVLITMRLWPALIATNNSRLLADFLDQLARHPQAELRLALLQELVRLPALRGHLFVALRGHDKPNSIQQLWQQLKGQPTCS